MGTPADFAADMQSVIGITPYWSKPTMPSIQVQQLTEPDKPSYAVVEPSGSWADAAKRALSYLDPFQSTLSPSGAVAQATVPLGKAGARALEAAADATQAAGSGITSGFKWATFIVIFGLLAYGFVLAAPFLPKPSGGR